MPSEHWGEIDTSRIDQETADASRKELERKFPVVEGTAIRITRLDEDGTVLATGPVGPDGKFTSVLGMDPATLLGASVAVSMSPPPAPGVKITINNVQLGEMPSGYKTRIDEIGEPVLELDLTDYQLNKLYAENGLPQVSKSDTDKMIDAMTPIMAVAEQLKKTLGERGWTYEEAERVAGDFLRDTIVNGMKEASK